MAVLTAIPSVIPYWLSQGGKGSAPLGYTGITREALTRPMLHGSRRHATNGNGHSLWESWFFKLPQSGIHERGSAPYTSVGWVTRESLTRWQEFGSRDFALRKISDDWFFGASSPFGIPVHRTPIEGLSGWGGFPLCSSWVTREALTQAHSWANVDTELQTTAEDWFFGRTTGSEDMHILFTHKRYA